MSRPLLKQRFLVPQRKSAGHGTVSGLIAGIMAWVCLVFTGCPSAGSGSAVGGHGDGKEGGSSSVRKFETIPPEVQTALAEAENNCWLDLGQPSTLQALRSGITFFQLPSL